MVSTETVPTEIPIKLTVFEVIMDIFKYLCKKSFKSGIIDFNELSGQEQKDICQSYFDEKEGKDLSIIIVNSLFPGACYLSDYYSDSELGKKANNVIDAFNLEVSVINDSGPGPDLSCEFHPNGKRWGDE